MSTLSVTDYGFQWGPLLVQRLAAYSPRKGRQAYILEVRTDSGRLEIYSSGTGRSLRVWRDGEELLPVPTTGL